MGKFLKRTWRYVVAALTGKFEDLADPKVQIEQAIDEAGAPRERRRHETMRSREV